MSISIQKLEALASAGKWGEARAQCAELCRESPSDARLWFMAARIERQLGNIHQAIDHYRQAAALAPESTAVLFEYGQALQTSGNIQQATSIFQQLAQRDPANAQVALVLGGLLCQGNDFNNAKHYFERALQTKPDMIEALLGLCTVWSALDRPDQIVTCLERAISIQPQAHELHYNLGLILENMGRLDEAYLACERTLTLSPDYVQAVALQAGIRRRQGRYQEAIDLLDPYLLKDASHPRIVDAFLNLCHKVGRCDEAVTLSRRICAAGAISDQDLMCLRFSTGHVLDRLGQYDEAFDEFRKANQIRSVGSDIEALKTLVDDIISIHEADPGIKRSTSEANSPKLIFIIGMPRSGTTLVEQILASHPDVYGAGELTAMHDVQNAFTSLAGTTANYPRGMHELDETRIGKLREAYLSRLPIASQGALVVTDKQPGNFLTVGLIRTLFPDASIIHCTRDPRDTCLSCYFNNFSGLAYTYDLTLLGKTWRLYHKLMRHWEAISVPMLELSYEALVADTEKMTHALIDYCGLEWNDTCLRFHENERVVATVSHDQVNRPIYKGSVARWKHYEKHLAPLLVALNNA